jgi:hypothetical protein
MRSKNNDKSGGKKKQLKGNTQAVAQTTSNDSNVEDKGKGGVAVGKREKKLAKLAQRK